MKKLIALILVVFFNFSNTDVFAQDSVAEIRAQVKKIDQFTDNIVIYRKLDSLNNLRIVSPPAKAYIKLSLAGNAIKLQRYNEAVKIAYDGIALAKTYKLDTVHALFYIVVGSVNYYLIKYPEAIESFKKATALAKEKGIFNIQVRACQNIGSVYVEAKNFAVGEIYLKKAIEMSKDCEKECSRYRFMAFRVLAAVYSTQKQFTKAINIYRSLEEEAVAANDTTLITSVLMFHSVALWAVGEKKMALQKSDRALTLVRKYKSRTDDNFIAALKFQASNLAKNGNHERAYALRIEVEQLQKERFKATNQQQVNEMEAKFKVKEIAQQKDLAERNTIVEAQKKKLLVAVLIVVVMFFVLLITVAYLQNKRRKADDTLQQQKKLVDAILATEENERSRIAKDLHDGIVQDLAALKLNLYATAQLAPASLQDQLKTLLSNIDATTKDVRDISYQMMPVSLKELGLQHALNDLLNRSFEASKISFEFNVFGIEERLPEKTELTIYRICQELIHNTIKHSGATQVLLLLQLRNAILQLTYEDNGNGYDDTNVKNGIGLNSMASRIEMVNGNFEISSSPTAGTTVFIRIPL